MCAMALDSESTVHSPPVQDTVHIRKKGAASARRRRRRCAYAVSVALRSRCGVDHPSDLSDPGGRKATQLCVAVDKSLILGQVHTVHLVGCNKRFQPLDI